MSCGLAVLCLGCSDGRTGPPSAEPVSAAAPLTPITELYNSVIKSGSRAGTWHIRSQCDCGHPPPTESLKRGFTEQKRQLVRSEQRGGGRCVPLSMCAYMCVLCVHASACIWLCTCVIICVHTRVCEDVCTCEYGSTCVGVDMCVNTQAHV